MPSATEATVRCSSHGSACRKAKGQTIGFPIGGLLPSRRPGVACYPGDQIGAKWIEYTGCSKTSGLVVALADEAPVKGTGWDNSPHDPRRRCAGG